MNRRIWMHGTACAALVALAVGGGDGLSGAERKKDKTVRYAVVRLDTLGGTAGGGIGINNKGWITGVSTLDGDVEARATLWRKKLDGGVTGRAQVVVVGQVRAGRGAHERFGEVDDVGRVGAQRVRKTHPLGGDTGDGSSPASAANNRFGCTSGSGTGTAASKPRV